MQKYQPYQPQDTNNNIVQKHNKFPLVSSSISEDDKMTPDASTTIDTIIDVRTDNFEEQLKTIL